MAALASARAGHATRWLGMWVQWDANFYLSIAAQGYAPPQVITGNESGQSNLPFFPVFPATVAVIHQAGVPTQAAGVLAANLFLISAAFLLHRVAVTRAGSVVANWSIIALFGLPGSFILSAPMSEPPFLAISLLGAFLAQRGLFGGSALAASILTITRLTGITFGAGLALDWTIDRWRGVRRSYRDLFFLSLIPIPILVFMAFMLRLTGDALATMHAERAFWGQSFGIPFQNLFMSVWASQPRLRISGAIAATMAIVLLRGWRLFSAGEWFFVVTSVLAFASSDAAAPAVVRFMIGLYPVHLAFGQLCARRRVAQALIVVMIVVNLVLMTMWSQGSDMIW